MFKMLEVLMNRKHFQAETEQKHFQILTCFKLKPDYPDICSIPQKHYLKLIMYNNI